LQLPNTKNEAKAAGGYSGAQHVRQEGVICPKDLRMEAKRRMTEYEEDLTKASTKAVAASSSENSENDPFASPITHPRVSTLRRRRRTEGSKERVQSEDVVKRRRPKDEDGDFQHRESSIRRFRRRKCFYELDLVADGVRQAVMRQVNRGSI